MMTRIAVRCTAICLLSALFANQAHLQGQNLVIAAGAGYKKPVSEIIGSFQNESHIHVDAIYGNLQMVATQAKQSGEVSCIIGDKRFLSKLKTTISFVSFTKLGNGILVLAYRKGMQINDVSGILGKDVQSVFMPQDGKAIYGIAGKEALNALGYAQRVSPKLTQVATVPQVVSYLLTGEADVGFINLTEALANKDKLGGYIVVPQAYYSPIEIVAGTVTGFQNAKTCQQFTAYLRNETTKGIAAKYGL